MADRAKANPKIEFLWNTEVIDVLGADKVEGLKLRNTVDGTVSEASFTGLFVAIGHIPRSELIVGQINLDAEVLKSSTPVLVDFWAEWCGPCRAVGPILEDISNEYGSKIKIVKLNTDEESAIALKYGITSIPTMNVFVNGEVVKTIVGAKPKPAILKELESFIA